MNFEAFDRPADLVEGNLGAMNQRADEALTEAYEAIAALGGISLQLPPGPALPELPEINVPSPVPEPTPPDVNAFGAVGSFSDPSFEDLSQYLGLDLSDLDITVPEFESEIGSFVMPTRPSPIDTSGMPTEPTLDDVTVPSAPATSLPSVPTLVELDIPDFTFPELPTFSDTAPEFTEPRPSTEIIWSESDYVSSLMTDLTTKVREWLQGGTGLPADVQQAIFDASRGRIQQTAVEAEQTAFDAWAGRGFSMPPGMLVAQVNAAHEKSRLEQNAKERDITIEISKIEIENLRFAMERGIAIEGLLTRIFSEAAARSFEVAKFRIDSDLKLYDSAVTLFNAKQNAFSIAAQVFKTRIDAKLAELEVFKAQIDGEIAKGQVNESRVRSYEAQVKAVLSVVEVFKAQMDGARVAQDVNRGRIEAYKSNIDAYSAKLGAEKTRFDAYEAEVRAEAARAGAFEAEARAYGETVRAQGERANVKVRYIDAKIAALNASTNKYSARVQASTAAVNATLTAVQARAQAFAADVGRYTAEIQGKNSAAEISIRGQELRLRNLLAHTELQIKQYDAMMNRVIQSAQVIGDQLKAAGQFTSALATGAMSAIRVGANIGASGSVSDSQQYNVNINRRGADVA